MKLTSTGAIGIVIEYCRFCVLVRLEQEGRDVEVSTEYLINTG